MACLPAWVCGVAARDAHVVAHIFERHLVDTRGVYPNGGGGSAVEIQGGFDLKLPHSAWFGKPCGELA